MHLQLLFEYYACVVFLDNNIVFVMAQRYTEFHIPIGCQLQNFFHHKITSLNKNTINISDVERSYDPGEQLILEVI